MPFIPIGFTNMFSLRENQMLFSPLIRQENRRNQEVEEEEEEGEGERGEREEKESLIRAPIPRSHENPQEEKSSTSFAINDDLLQPPRSSFTFEKMDPYFSDNSEQLLKADQDDMEGNTLSSLHSRKGRRRGERLFIEDFSKIGPIVVMMSLTSIMNFLIPCLIPHLVDGNSTWYNWFNGEFLVLPSIGAGLTSVHRFRSNFIIPFLVAESFLFLFSILPAFNVIQSSLSIAPWIIFCGLTFLFLQSF